MLQTDALSMVVDAGLNHIFPNRSEKLVMFGSRYLTPVERNYSQIEKEVLSIVWSVKWFYQALITNLLFLYFTLIVVFLLLLLHE